LRKSSNVTVQSAASEAHSIGLSRGRAFACSRPKVISLPTRSTSTESSTVSVQRADVHHSAKALPHRANTWSRSMLVVWTESTWQRLVSGTSMVAVSRQLGEVKGPYKGCQRTCLNSDRPVRTATRHCLPTRWRRVFAPTSVRFAPPASTRCLRTYARIAAVDLFPDPSDRRGTGKATIFSGRTLRAPRSGTGPLIRRPMRGSRQPSRPYRLTNGRARKTSYLGA
jgi:hypothetical protein